MLMMSVTGSYVDGGEVVLLVARELYELIRGVLLLDDACELLVARAEGTASGVVLKSSSATFEELIEYVASEANAETNRRRMRSLDKACRALESALAAE